MDTLLEFCRRSIGIETHTREICVRRMPAFDLTHHLVFSTQHRKGVFGATIGESLTEYWLQVAAKRNFALDQISIVPDHIHMIVRIVPKMSIEEVALSLMNNGQYFIGERYPELLIRNS